MHKIHITSQEMLEAIQKTGTIGKAAKKLGCSVGHIYNQRCKDRELDVGISQFLVDRAVAKREDRAKLVRFVMQYTSETKASVAALAKRRNTTVKELILGTLKAAYPDDIVYDSSEEDENGPKQGMEISQGDDSVIVQREST